MLYLFNKVFLVHTSKGLQAETDFIDASGSHYLANLTDDQIATMPYFFGNRVAVAQTLEALVREHYGNSYEQFITALLHHEVDRKLNVLVNVADALPFILRWYKTILDNPTPQEAHKLIQTVIKRFEIVNMIRVDHDFFSLGEFVAAWDSAQAFELTAHQLLVIRQSTAIELRLVNQFLYGADQVDEDWQSFETRFARIANQTHLAMLADFKRYTLANLTLETNWLHTPSLVDLKRWTDNHPDYAFLLRTDLQAENLGNLTPEERDTIATVFGRDYLELTGTDLEDFVKLSGFLKAVAGDVIAYEHIYRQLRKTSFLFSGSAYQDKVNGYLWNHLLNLIEQNDHDALASYKLAS